jgi:hypothetical protein
MKEKQENEFCLSYKKKKRKVDVILCVYEEKNNHQSLKSWIKKV